MYEKRTRFAEHMDGFSIERQINSFKCVNWPISVLRLVIDMFHKINFSRKTNVYGTSAFSCLGSQSAVRERDPHNQVPIFHQQPNGLKKSSNKIPPC